MRKEASGRWSACAAGWGDCNQDPSDGCETGLASDDKNCAGCGMACKIPNAVARCAHKCYLAACLYGFVDCNADDSDGCEAPRKRPALVGVGHAERAIPGHPQNPH